MSDSKGNKISLPTNKDTEKYEMLSPMLNSVLEEMREFAKKKQDGVLSPLKIKIINRLLIEIKNILSLEKSASYLDILDEDALPQNSDVVIILGQFRTAMNQFHNKYFKRDNYLRESRWFTKENPGVPDRE